jgi:hypothetical protein
MTDQKSSVGQQQHQMQLLSKEEEEVARIKFQEDWDRFFQEHRNSTEEWPRLPIAADFLYTDRTNLAIKVRASEVRIFDSESILRKPSLVRVLR